MRKPLLLFLIMHIPLFHLLAQNLFPNAYEFKSDSATWNVIPHLYWQILEDKTGTLTINEVSKDPVQKQFHDSTKGIDSTAYTYWLRFNIKNAKNNTAFISHDGVWEFADLYITDSTGRLKHFRTGEVRDWSERDGYKYVSAIPDTLTPFEERKVYVRFQSKHKGLPSNFGVGFYNTGKTLDAYYVPYVESRTIIYSKANLQEAFIIGMVLLAAFMNFFFYRIVKEKLYLYFALFALSLGINRMYGISYSYFLFYNQQYGEYVRYLGYAWVFIIFSLVQFFREFLNTRQKFPKTDKILITLFVVFLMTSLTGLVAKIFILNLPGWINRGGNFFAHCLIPFILISLQIFALRRGNKTNKFVLAGSFPLLFQYLVSVFFTPDGFYLYKDSAFTQFLSVNFRIIEAINLAILLITFTWVLFMRFIDLRKQNAQQALDKERLAKEKEIERNELIAKQKIDLEKEVAERTLELRQSLNELKAAQAQLIQSEKMVSLGELTAGIAHEIQNPLNFVNNFSEVNTELLTEIKQEIEKGSTDELKNLITEVEANEWKINHHGRRADAIVKGMLQHSRTATGEKQLTDINALAEEYLRLSYHGLRAKDKSFNADFKTNFDESIGKIVIVPQDIGRVLLNLFNNAFYAVHEHLKKLGDGYKPTVTVTTRKLADKIEIEVKDNGMGISKSVQDKIFQPFFTTKPTGQGTGLGLSLSYDIVKAHDGELRVESKESEGAVFVIQLPAKTN